MIHSKLIFILFKVDTIVRMTFECQGEQVFTYISEARERQRERERLILGFKELAYVIVGAGKSEINRVDH